MDNKTLKKRKPNISLDTKEKGENDKNSVIVPIKKDDAVIVDGKKYLHEPDEEFESCCFKCDKPLCLYIGKFSISVAVMLFCFFMLQDKANSAEFYTGTIAGLLGHYLNTPIATPPKRTDKKDKED